MQWIFIFDSSHFQFLPNGGGLEIQLLATLQDTDMEENVENLVLNLKTNNYTINFQSAGYDWEASGIYSKSA